jgi:hypothetical protein
MSEKERTEQDQDGGKGAVEQNAPDQDTNTSMAGQLGHRSENPLIKSNDTDYPEPGENPEHSGEPEDGGILKDNRRTGITFYQAIRIATRSLDPLV